MWFDDIVSYASSNAAFQCDYFSLQRRNLSHVLKLLKQTCSEHYDANNCM